MSYEETYNQNIEKLKKELLENSINLKQYYNYFNQEIIKKFNFNYKVISGNEFFSIEDTNINFETNIVMEPSPDLWRISENKYDIEVNINNYQLKEFYLEIYKTIKQYVNDYEIKKIYLLDVANICGKANINNKNIFIDKLIEKISNRDKKILFLKFNHIGTTNFDKFTVQISFVPISNENSDYSNYINFDINCFQKAYNLYYPWYDYFHEYDDLSLVYFYNLLSRENLKVLIVSNDNYVNILELLTKKFFDKQEYILPDNKYFFNKPNFNQSKQNNWDDIYIEKKTRTINKSEKFTTEEIQNFMTNTISNLQSNDELLSKLQKNHDFLHKNNLEKKYLKYKIKYINLKKLLNK